MPESKLHELIAVRSGTNAQATKTTEDLKHTFEKKQHHFTATVQSFTPFGENTVTAVEKKLDLQTTVLSELGWIKTYLAKAIDASNAVNIGNTQAFADVVLEDGTILLQRVAATTLLELEDRVEDLRKLAAVIPTLDPVKGFTPDADRGKGVYAARLVEKVRTQKQKKLYVLYAATKEHPAQTQLIDEDVPTGKIEEREWSSMLTPHDKAAMLDRIEMLARAVKSARSRANSTEVAKPEKLGDILVGYAFGL